MLTFITVLIMHTKERVNQLIWVIVFSIGYFSLKGGVFTILSGGGFHVLGPDSSEIHENNALGVAILMIIPLMVYIYRYPPHPLVKTGMPYVIFFSVVAVAGTQSRGALVAVSAVGGYFWWRSKSKALTGLALIFLAVITLIIMPKSWTDRMKTITNYETDSSAMERITAWRYAINVANGRFTGGGFNSWSIENYAAYGVPARKAFVAHSLYFGVLNDGGWVGLAAYLLILFLMWRQLGRVIKITKDAEEHQDIHFLAQMMKVSMVAYMTGGTFLSLAYYDLAWHFMAIIIALHTIVQVDSSDVAVARRHRRAPARRRRKIAAGT